MLKPKFSYIYVLHERLTNETRDYYYYIQQQHQRIQDTNGLSFVPQSQDFIVPLASNPGLSFVPPPGLSLLPQSQDCPSCLKARTLLRASTSSKRGLSFVPPPGLSLYLKARTFLGVQPGCNNINISISIRSLFDLYLISISIRSLFDLYLYSISIRSLSLFNLYSISIRSLSLFDLFIRSLFVLFIRSLFDLYSTTHHLILLQVSFYFCNPLSFPHSSLYSSRGSVGAFQLLQFYSMCVYFQTFLFMFVLLLRSLLLSCT